MAVTIGRTVRVGWDYDSVEPGEATGVVVAWLPDTDRPVPSCVVRLVEPLTTSILGSADDKSTAVSGSYLVLTTRYVGQSWDDNEGTVHATLHINEPSNVVHSAARQPAPWIASHAVYRVT